MSIVIGSWYLRGYIGNMGRDTGPQILRGRRTETRRTLTQACRVPPTGVGFWAACHPGNWGGFLSGREITLRSIYTGSLPRGGYHNTGIDDQRPASSKLRTHHTGPHTDTQTSQGKWTASCVLTGHLVAALQCHVNFRSGEQAQLFWDGFTEIRRRKFHVAG